MIWLNFFFCWRYLRQIDKHRICRLYSNRWLRSSSLLLIGSICYCTPIERDQTPMHTIKKINIWLTKCMRTRSNDHHLENEHFFQWWCHRQLQARDMELLMRIRWDRNYCSFPWENLMSPRETNDDDHCLDMTLRKWTREVIDHLKRCIENSSMIQWMRLFDGQTTTSFCS